MQNDKEIQRQIDDALLRIKRGWTFGFKNIDKLAGRFEKGQVIVVGGMTGTGKSYFIINMIEGIKKEARTVKIEGYIQPKILVLTTEMDSISYEKRYICLKARTYWNVFLENPENYYEEIQKAKEEFYADQFVNPSFLQIRQINALEDIQKVLSELEDKPNIVIIDHVQNLSVKGKSDNKETMATIGNVVRDIAIKNGVALICVSQINLSILGKDNNPKHTNVQPFSWGKELLQSAHTALLLNRQIEDGKMSEYLQVGVIKAREGNKGWLEMLVSNGFNLVEETNGRP